MLGLGDFLCFDRVCELMFWLSFVRDADKAELGLSLFDLACFEMLASAKGPRRGCDALLR